MKKLSIYLVIATIALMASPVYAGCGGCAGTLCKADVGKTLKNIMLCGHCGEVKTGQDCGIADGPECPDCGLHAGAPGCCEMEAGKDVELCGKCGEIKGGDDCCVADGPGVADFAVCESCGMYADSPGCKINCNLAYHSSHGMSDDYSAEADGI